MGFHPISGNLSLGRHIRSVRNLFSPEPDSRTFERLADQALSGLPRQFREQLTNVALRVVDFATREQLDAVGIEDRWHLSGLYEGTPLPERSQWAPTEMPPTIWLFRRPLIAEWQETGVELSHLVRHVVIHEAGHHFGFSDEEMHWIENQRE